MGKYKYFLYLFNMLINNIFGNIQMKPLTMAENNWYIQLNNDPRVKYQSLSFQQKDNVKPNTLKYKLQETNILLKIQGIFLDNTCIGYMGFFKDNTRPNILFIYYAVEPKYWNKGIGTLAVKKFINDFKILAKQQGFKYIKATIKIDNIGSQRILEKNNFKIILNKNGNKLVKLIDGQNIVYEYELPL